MKRFLLAVLAGGLLNVAYENVQWLLAIVAIAVFVKVIENTPLRTRLLCTVGFFFTYWILVIDWIKVLGQLPWVLLAIICTLPYLVLAARSVSTKSFSSAISFASMWVVAEFVHAEFPWGGFPWGLIAYTQTDGPLVNTARVGGQYLTTFIVVLIAVSISSFWRKTSWLRISVIAVVVLMMNVLLNPPAIDGVINVAAVQGSVPREGYDTETQRRAVLNNHLLATQELLDTQPPGLGLILWPENAVDNDPFNNPVVLNKVNEVSKWSSSPILVGGLVKVGDTEDELNSGILWTAGQPGEMYSKHQLVPFGEYIPTGSFLREFIEAQMPYIPRLVPGTSDGIFTLADGTTFGDVICFEIANENFVRERVRNGAQFITVQTNNATYSETHQPAQQLNITRFRAIENQRSIVVAATTGYTVIVNHGGEVVQQVPPLARGFIVDEIALSSDQQLVHRWGSNALVLLCAIYLVFGLRKVRQRGAD